MELVAPLGKMGLWPRLRSRSWGYQAPALRELVSWEGESHSTMSKQKCQAQDKGTGHQVMGAGSFPRVVPPSAETL